MQLLVKTALSYLHQPYMWGGDDPSGFDCSGLTQEILKSVNADPPGDQTAHKLYSSLKSSGAKPCRPCAGAVVFFGAKKIIHVGFCVSTTRMVDAAGGGKHVKTYKDAIKYNAFVKISWIRRRNDYLCSLMPDYKELEYND